jgi:hypothetical protein
MKLDLLCAKVATLERDLSELFQRYLASRTIPGLDLAGFHTLFKI